MIEEVRTTATIRVDQATTFTPTLFSRSNGRGDPIGTMTRRLEHISQDASSAQFWYTFEGLYGLSSTEMTDLCVLKLYKRNPHETCKVLSPPILHNRVRVFSSRSRPLSCWGYSPLDALHKRVCAIVYAY